MLDLKSLLIAKKLFNSSGGAGGGNDNSVVGTWDLSEEIFWALDVIDTQEKYEAYLENPYKYTIKGYNGNGFELGKVCCVKINGTFADPGGPVNTFDNYIKVEDENAVIGYYSDEGGWMTSSRITITEQPSAEVEEWVKYHSRRVVLTQPFAYTVSSVDELPSDAVDGSTAIVPSDSLIGEWQFNETLTPMTSESCAEGDLLFVADNEEFSGLFITELNSEQYNMHTTFLLDNCVEPVYDFINNEWMWDIFKRIKITRAPNNEAFKEWFNLNANKISGGYSLYIRENGEWIYKCEVV